MQPSSIPPGQRKTRHPLYPGKILFILRGGFLLRTFGIVFTLSAVAVFIAIIERAFPNLDNSFPIHLFPPRGDQEYAQGILSTVAGAVMTVVSIVFAIVLMTLTLASSQFSPRIISGFTQDRITQWTLGLFLGTFSYCVATMAGIRPVSPNHVPVIAVTGALLLAFLCVVWLLFFIDHIAIAISANHIVDRIARETEGMVDEMMPKMLVHGDPRPVVSPPVDPEGVAILSIESGYIRHIEMKSLLETAKANKIAIRVVRRVGHFVPEGVALATVSKTHKMNSAIDKEIVNAFDLGPTRSLQQDVEYGILQIVDIALKAISPAVNDPSTGICCVDQLSRILIRIAGREPIESNFYDPPGTLRISIPSMDLERYVLASYEQIRIYAKGDVAVCLRLLRALNDISTAVADATIRKMLADFGRKVVESSHLEKDETMEMTNRLVRLEQLAQMSNA